MPTCTIIGAGEGLGSALAAKFASGGFDIALVSRTEAGSIAARDAAVKAGTDAQVKFFPADVTQPETLEKALGMVAAEMSDIDVLIYNVRGSYTKIEPLDMTYDMIDAVHKLEVIGAFAAVKAVLPGMRLRGLGSIFFSSATASLRGSAVYPLYSIGKFGMRALSQSFARAYARDGVHIVHVRLDCELDVPFTRSQHAGVIDEESYQSLPTSQTPIGTLIFSQDQPGVMRLNSDPIQSNGQSEKTSVYCSW